MAYPIEYVIVVLVFAAAFFLGSIPWGVLISKFFYKTDIRQHGSGNIGTTNAFRALGKVGGVAVFILDFAKGLLSGVLAIAARGILLRNTINDPYCFSFLLALAFLACVLGHIFSPWLGFKGGKGIAVAIGCLFVAFGPFWAIIELSIFGVLVVATRYVSAGSLAAALACPFISLHVFWGNPHAWVCTCIAACIVIWAHRANISRLVQGSENRIGQKKKDPTDTDLHPIEQAVSSHSDTDDASLQ